MSPIRKVMVFGTFDGLHEGHLDLFRQGKVLGDYLIVVVARDVSTEQIKGHKPIRYEQDRLEAVKKAPLVDEAVLGEKEDRHAVIVRYRPAIIALGYDQHSFEAGLEQTLYEHDMTGTKIVRLESYQPDIYKSSLLNK